MIYSISSSTDRARRLLGALAAVLLAASAPAAEPSVAVFPPINRSGGPVSDEVVVAALASALTRQGYHVLPAAELEAFLERHRVRDTSGVTAEVAAALGVETGAQAAILTSIDDWEDDEPPRVALTARWVSTTTAEVLWFDSQARHGWERQGAFGQGYVSGSEVLLHWAARGLAESLAQSARAAAGRGPAPRKSTAQVDGRFRPKILSVDSGWAATAPAEGRPLIAVLPFVPSDVRREVGEVVMLQVAKHLAMESEGTVIEPGIVRGALLEARVIQDGGPSVAQVDALRALLDVDLVVSGLVTDFDSSGSAPRTPSVGFSVRAFDTATRQVVWTAISHARGDDSLGPFGAGRIRSGIELLSELARGVVQGVAREVEKSRARSRGGKRKE